tara:strand:+ start:392 stop:718 length:327 start_codon:yes stop_codon:yes gene_type:complete
MNRPTCTTTPLDWLLACTAPATSEPIARGERVKRNVGLIIAGLSEAGAAPDDTWWEMKENINVRCWALGFEAARRGFVHGEREEWAEAEAIVRRSWEDHTAATRQAGA